MQPLRGFTIKGKEMTNPNENITLPAPVFNKQFLDLQDEIFHILVGDGAIRYSSPCREDIDRIVSQHFWPVKNDIDRTYSFLPWVNVYQEG